MVHLASAGVPEGKLFDRRVAFSFVLDVLTVGFCSINSKHGSPAGFLFFFDQPRTCRLASNQINCAHVDRN